jgi:hypothetical protein
MHAVRRAAPLQRRTGGPTHRHVSRPWPAGQRGHGDVRAAAGSPPAPSRGEMLRCDGAAVLRRPPSSALEQPVGGGPHVQYAATPAGWTAHVACNVVRRGGRERACRDAVLLERAGVKERRCSVRSRGPARRRAAHRGFPRPAHRAHQCMVLTIYLCRAWVRVPRAGSGAARCRGVPARRRAASVRWRCCARPGSLPAHSTDDMGHQ